MRTWFKNAAIFSLGLLSGVTATGLTLRHCYEPPPMSRPNEVLDRLSEKLDLNTEQRDKISVLLQKELLKGEALHKETHKKFKALRNSFDDQIKPYLDPEQQKKLEIMSAQWEKSPRSQSRLFVYRWSFRMGATPSCSSTVTIK